MTALARLTARSAAARAAWTEVCTRMAAAARTIIGYAARTTRAAAFVACCRRATHGFISTLNRCAGFVGAANVRTPPRAARRAVPT